jgi:hypothetical protein
MVREQAVTGGDYQPPLEGQQRACSLTASTTTSIDLLSRPVSNWA